MKVLFICIIVMLFVVSCSRNKVINGKLYETYGLINKETVKSDSIKYQLVAGNAVLGTLFFGTVIAPIYFFGFDIYEPVSK